MAKEKNEIIKKSEALLDDSRIYDYVACIIETRKRNAGIYANLEVTLMYWEVGHYVNSIILNGNRAVYGKQIVTELASQLMVKYGKTFLEQARERLNRRKLLPSGDLKREIFYYESKDDEDE